MVPVGDREYKVDLLPPLSLAIHSWILLFGLWSTFAVVLANEFFSIHVGYWLSIFIGVPLATAISTGLALTLFFLKKIQDPPHQSVPMQISDWKRAQSKITRAWIIGGIATITALFAHYNPGGKGHDFSPTNLVDAAITATLTFGLYKQKLWSAALLLGYFIFWKMIFWSYNQPRAVSFAGIIMAIFLWQGIVGIILTRRWNATKHSP